MELLVIAAVLLLVPALIVAMIYNGFISRRNSMRYAFSTIDVQLKKRWDLVPNLVETVKGYAAHERATLEEVVRLRDAAGEPIMLYMAARRALAGGAKESFNVHIPLAPPAVRARHTSPCST